jgi:[ribosomal protein S18]-alanine N-acetyltransferase
MSELEFDVQIRWLIRRDMPEVLSIEAAAFEYPWDEEDFLVCLRQRNCIGMIAEREHEIIGFMVYSLHKSRINLMNIAVDPQFHRSGVGRQMIERLKDKLSQQRRKEISTEVRERNLPAQQFFSSQGFRATRILRDHYEDTSEDAYLMSYRLGEKAAVKPTHTNRITEFIEESDA